jgi:hypothetical protein
MRVPHLGQTILRGKERSLTYLYANAASLLEIKLKHQDKPHPIRASFEPEARSSRRQNILLTHSVVPSTALFKDFTLFLTEMYMDLIQCYLQFMSLEEREAALARHFDELVSSLSYTID